jgi:hypothetical protein
LREGKSGSEHEVETIAKKYKVDLRATSLLKGAVSGDLCSRT